jgi:hypothetical protein
MVINSFKFLETFMKNKHPTIIVAVLLTIASLAFANLQAGNCMPLPANAYINANDTEVYTITGRNLNVSIKLQTPNYKSYNSTVDFSLSVLDSFFVPSTGSDLIHSDDYSLSRVTLDAYLISGVVLDYDRSKIINPIWVSWGNAHNASYLEEERLLFTNSHDVLFSKNGSTYFGSTTLPELSEGTHNLTVWVRAEHDEITTYIPLWAAISKTISFTINSTRPEVSLLAPTNITYRSVEVPLNFVFRDQVSEVMYSLDGQSNVSVSGNTTLPQLPIGSHNITVYATDEGGNTGSSRTIFFIVTQESLPFLPLIVAIAIVACTLISILVYEARKRTASKSSHHIARGYLCRQKSIRFSIYNNRR